VSGIRDLRAEIEAIASRVADAQVPSAVWRTVVDVQGAIATSKGGTCTVEDGLHNQSFGVRWFETRPVIGDVVLVSVPPPTGTRYVIHIDREVITTHTAPQRTIYGAGAATYTVPAGCVWLHVRGVAAGGGGGAITATGAGENASAGGGGGGCGFDLLIAPSALDTAVSVSVGAGGAGGVAGAHDGSNGNNTQFGASGKSYFVQVNGGSGGSQGANSSTSTVAAGGVGGVLNTNSAGAVIIIGGDGGNGQVIGGIRVLGGNGGMSLLGTPTRQPGNTTGFVGSPYGGGGTGAAAIASQAARAGGAGADGVLIIDAYFS
jgi:hypothetical protein